MIYEPLNFLKQFHFSYIVFRKYLLAFSVQSVRITFLLIYIFQMVLKEKIKHTTRIFNGFEYASLFQEDFVHNFCPNPGELEGLLPFNSVICWIIRDFHILLFFISWLSIAKYLFNVYRCIIFIRCFDLIILFLLE